MPGHVVGGDVVVELAEWAGIDQPQPPGQRAGCGPVAVTEPILAGPREGHAADAVENLRHLTTSAYSAEQAITTHVNTLVCKSLGVRRHLRGLALTAASAGRGRLQKSLRREQRHERCGVSDTCRQTR
jgi:hypothetical protein